MATAIKNSPIPLPPVPSQFLRSPQQATPERRLLAAVLEDAVRIIRCGPAYRRRTWERANAYREAIAWVSADRDAWPFCFIAVCEALGFDADSVRTRLLGERLTLVNIVPGNAQATDHRH